MNSLSKWLIKLNTYTFKTWYVFSELCLAQFCTKPKMNILFSKKTDRFERNIRQAFRFLPHTLTFAEIKHQPIAKYDLVVPLSIEDTLYLNEIRDSIKDNPIAIPSTECVKLCDDKYAFAQKLIANNFGDYIPQIDGNLSYPFFFKKKIDDTGEHTYRVENREQELELLNSVNIDEYFRQAFVSGTDEYTTHIFFDKQRIVRSITLMYIYEKDGSIGGKDEKFGIKMIRDCPYLDIFTSILNTVGFEGICCFDYKVINNRPYIFELNPFFGGTLALYFFSFMRSLNQLK